MLATYGNISKKVLKIYPNSTVFKGIDDLVNTLTLDPEISGIDTIVLHDTNISSISLNATKLVEALKDKHPVLNVLIFCRNEAQANRIRERTANVDKLETIVEPHTTDDNIRRHIDYFAQQNESQLISASEVITTDMVPATEAEPEEVGWSEDEYIESKEEEQKADIELEVVPQVELDDPEPEIQVQPKEDIPPIIEQDYMTLQDIQNNLQMDKILKKMAANSTDFVNLTDKLQILEKHLVEINKDSSLTTSQKLEMMRSVVTEKAFIKSMSNSILTDTLISILDTVFATVVTKLDEEISSCKSRIATISEKELYHKNQKTITSLIESKFNLQKTLSDNLYTLQQVYSRATQVVADAQQEMCRGIPSENMYLNNCYDKVFNIGVNNLTEHVNKLLDAYSNKSVSLSILETHIRNLLQSTAELCELSDNIIATQQELIDTMSVNKVEDVVIMDTVLKNAMRIYAGVKDSGKTATVAIMSQVHSRVGNTLVLDFTKENSLATYVPDMLDLNKLLGTCNDGTQSYLYCTDIGNIDMAELRSYLVDCLTRYRFIDILVDEEAVNTKQFQELLKESLSITVVTNCNITKFNGAKRIIKHINEDNIARFICVVNPSVAPTEIFEILDINPMKYKYVAIPNMSEISRCALRQTNPGFIVEVRTIFEEAFN